VLILIALILLRRWPNLQLHSPTKKTIVRAVLVFLATILVQVLIIATGGIYSPLLFLIHIATLGYGLALTFRSAILFWLTGLLAVILSLVTNQLLLSAFYADPWTVISYLFSFTLTIPIVYVLISYYHLKDRFNDVLKTYIKEQTNREEAIFEGLAEIVVVFNEQAKILSINEAGRQFLSKTNHEIIFYPLLETFQIYDVTGKPLDQAALKIDQILSEKTVHMLESYAIGNHSNNDPIPVNIQIKTVPSIDRGTELLVMIISPAKKKYDEQYLTQIQKMLNEHNDLVQELKSSTQAGGEVEIIKKVEILNQAERDLLTVIELENRAIEPNLILSDVFAFFQQKIQLEQEFAKNFQVNLMYQSPEPSQSENTSLDASTHLTLDYEKRSSTDFLAQLDTLWFGLLLQKIIDLSIFLASNSEAKTIQLNLFKGQENINITISISADPSIQDHLEDIFRKGYGKLEISSKVKYVTGLEGYIAKTISDQLGTPLEVKYLPELNKLTFNLSLSQNVSNQLT
jgi:PAS domain-containing protein